MIVVIKHSYLRKHLKAMYYALTKHCTSQTFSILTFNILMFFRSQANLNEKKTYNKVIS